MNAFFLGTGLVMGVLAGLCAFLITYEEDRRHSLDRQLPLRHALEAAVFAAGVFLLLAVIVGWLFSSFFS